MADDDPTPEDLIEPAEQTVRDSDGGLTTLTKDELAWLKKWIHQNKQNPEANPDPVTLRKVEALTLEALPPQPDPEPEAATPAPTPPQHPGRVRRLRLTRR